MADDYAEHLRQHDEILGSLTAMLVKQDGINERLTLAIERLDRSIERIDRTLAHVEITPGARRDSAGAPDPAPGEWPGRLSEENVRCLIDFSTRHLLLSCIVLSKPIGNDIPASLI